MAVTDGCYTCRPGSMFAGVRFDVGPMCRLRIRNVEVLVASRPEQMYDDEPFLLHGIDIQTYRIVGIKGANHFRAGYAPLSGRMITVDGGGLSSADLSTFARRRNAGPLWPLDDVP
jgi:microcystin degradation protein MlrC